MRNHLLIGDTQVKADVPLDHLHALGRMIAVRKPEVIVHVGDHWDMPSLSSYDEGTFRMEGRRIEADIAAGNEAMEIIDDAIDEIPNYEPERVFLIGNHEERIERFLNDNPRFLGYLGYEEFNLENWEVIPFLQIINIDGIRYSHYFCNPFTGRPYGGSIMNKLNKLKFSFAMGHVQKLEFHKEYLNDGGVVNGLTCGSFYLHDEDYKGPQGNNHWRGVVMLNGVSGGNYDLETISMDRLLTEYSV